VGQAGSLRRVANPPFETSWSRDEWDLRLNDGALYRLYRHRALKLWFIEGVYD
jgi:hypothetical protein